MRKRSSTGFAVIGALLLLSIVFVHINTIINGHTHRDAHGILTFHAHPFQKSPSRTAENHHHNNFELLFYRIIGRLLEHGIIAAIIWQFILMFITRSLLDQSEKPKVWCRLNPFSRGPPRSMRRYFIDP